MKKLIALILLCATPAMAVEQNAVIIKKPAQDLSSVSLASQGLRVGVVIPAWQISKDVSGVNPSSKSTGVENAVGASVGYASLPINRVGWIAGGSLLQAEAYNDTYVLLRGDGNLAYTFSNRMNAKVGLNISKLIRAEMVDQYGLGMGYQFGVGAQFNKTLAFDFTIANMSQSATSKGATTDLRQQGVEMSVSATF